MAYDQPYRLEEISHVRHDPPYYRIMRTGEGTVCTGDNFSEMRNLVDRANEAAMQEMGDRGR